MTKAKDTRLKGNWQLQGNRMGYEGENIIITH